jgi:Retroviral aspartyl protease
LGKGFSEVKHLSVSDACRKFDDANFKELRKMSVTPHRKFFNRNIKLKAQIRCNDGSLKWFDPEIDNGCTITCIHPRIVRKYGLQTKPLSFSIPIVNADGSDNKQKESSLTAIVNMIVERHIETIEALVLDIGSNEMLLGLDWLTVHNPMINWKEGIVRFIRCPVECQRARADQLRKIDTEKDKPTLDQNGLSQGIIPDYVKNKYGYLFEPRNFDKVPKRREWDHAITLVADAPKSIAAQNY